MSKCEHCKKECKKTVTCKNKNFCCDVCRQKYEKNHKPKVCEFC